MCLGRIYDHRNLLLPDKKDGSPLAIAGFLLFGIAMTGFIPIARDMVVGTYVIASGMIIYGLAVGGWLSSMFSTRWMILLGESSYALYLLQISIYLTIKALAGFPRWNDYYASPESVGPLLYFVSLFITVTISMLAFTFYETPLRTFIRSRFGARPRVALRVPDHRPSDPSESVG